MSTPNTGNLPPDRWNSGEAYEQYVGRWSRMVGAEFLKWLSPSESADWLDIGCGTGTLSRLILSDCKPRSVIGVDPSEGFIAFAATDIPDARASFQSGDARAIPVQSTSVDYTVAGLVINFVPDDDQMQAMSEVTRVTRSGGTVAAYVWDYLGEMQMMRHFWDAAIELDPSVAQRDEGSRFPLCQPGPLADLFSSSGWPRCRSGQLTCRRYSRISTITGVRF